MKKAIYKITNQLNDKIYIGQSQHPERRWVEHCCHANNNTDDYPIHLAIKKYGKDNFSFEILEWTEDYNQREKDLIKQYNSFSPNGYNLAEGGPSPVFYGEDHPNCKISNADVLNVIRELQENKITDRAIAKKYGISDKIVADINHGYSHKIEGVDYPIRIKHGSQKLTEDQANQIKSLLKNSNQSYSQLGQQFGVTKGTIYQINRGTNFKRPNEEYPIRKREATKNGS